MKLLFEVSFKIICLTNKRFQIVNDDMSLQIDYSEKTFHSSNCIVWFWGSFGSHFITAFFWNYKFLKMQLVLSIHRHNLMTLKNRTGNRPQHLKVEMQRFLTFTYAIQTSEINDMEYLCNKVIALEMCVIIAYQLNNSLLKLLVMNVNLVRLSHECGNMLMYSDLQ